MMIPADFHFERPLWLLALVPVAFLLWQGLRSTGRGGAWRDAVDAHLLRHLALPGEAGVRRWPLWLLGLGWLAATLAMAGPSWERLVQPTTKTIEPTVVALDMSVSMDAEDLTPSRLARARYELQDVLDRSAGGQVGLVIFSDEPFVASPLTDDGRVISEMIPLLTTDIMPGRGSRPDRAIDQAVALLDQAGVPGGRILLLGDSAGDDPAATRQAAARAAADGRRVSVLGVGTPEGAPVPDGHGGFARTGDGEVFVAHLPTSELDALASAGGGRFAQVSAGTADIDVVMAEPVSLSSIADEEVDEIGTTGGADVEVWKDAGVHLLFLPVLLAPLAFRRGWLAVALLAVTVGAPDAAHASAWDDLWQTRDQQGAAALKSGDAAGASGLFEAPDWRAAAQYESGDFDQAGQAFASLSGLENRYNLGNALAKSGKLEEAIAAYDEVLEEAPEHEDAKFNRDLVEQLLKQQQEQQRQDPSQSGQSEQAGDGSQDQQQSQQGASGSSSDQSRSSSQSDPPSEDSAAEQASAQDQAQSQDQPQSQDRGESQGQEQQQGASASESADESRSASAGDSAAQDDPQEQAQAEARDGGRASRTSEPADSRDEQARAPRPEPDADEPNSMTDRVDQVLDETEPQAEDESDARVAGGGSSEPMSEERQAREQMLRQIPDDPAGLLRAKIRRTYAEKRFAEQQRRLVQQGGSIPWW